MVRALSLVLVLTVAEARAQENPPAVAGPDLKDMMHARNVAMGGAYMSLGYGAESIGGNPAALSAYRRYLIEASGAWDIPNGMGLGTIGLADSTNAFAMGLSYHFITFGGLERRWGHITTIGVSYALANWLHLGVAGRHHVLIGASNTNSVTMNAGLLIRPLQFLSIGVSGHNLIFNFNRDITRFFVLSVSGMFFNQLSPCFDLRADFNESTARFAYHGGVEWLIANSVPIRAGYQFDGILNRQYLSAGIGWFSQGSGIDFAYRHELGGDLGRMVALTVKLQVAQ
jgi:hypothetical protein